MFAPCFSKSPILSIDGASLKSSVPGLNVKPKTATFSPLKVINLSLAFLYNFVFCSLLTSTAASTVLNV